MHFARPRWTRTSRSPDHADKVCTLRNAGWPVSWLSLPTCVTVGQACSRDGFSLINRATESSFASATRGNHDTEIIVRLIVAVEQTRTQQLARFPRVPPDYYRALAQHLSAFCNTKLANQPPHFFWNEKLTIVIATNLQPPPTAIVGPPRKPTSPCPASPCCRRRQVHSTRPLSRRPTTSNTIPQASASPSRPASSPRSFSPTSAPFCHGSTSP